MRMYTIKCRGKLEPDVYETRAQAKENMDMFNVECGAKVVPVSVVEIKARTASKRHGK